VKAKLTKSGESAMHQHVEVPKALPSGAKLWIEVETGSGPVRGSIDFKK
jgi:hypothetical protein